MPTNRSDAGRTMSRTALKSAVDIWNARAEHKLWLSWNVGDWGTIEYDSCQVSFRLERPRPSDAPQIRFYQFAESEIELSTKRETYRHLQSVCELGVVPMLKPHSARDCIVLEGVSFSMAVAEITGGQIVDIVNRLSTAACAVQLLSCAWSMGN